jgi:hypothetical protein
MSLSRNRNVKRPAVATALGLMMAATGGLSGTAQAETKCAYALPNWNVPNGALIVSRAKDGPILQVMNAIGEKFTHSALSHGSSATISHSSFMQPPSNSPWLVCSQPVSAAVLNRGWPGPERVNAGATWAFYFNDQNNAEVSWQSGNNSAGDWAFWPQRLTANQWQWFPGNSNRGAMVANQFMSLPMGTDSPNRAVPIYCSNPYSCAMLGYDFTQYMDMKNADLGWANTIDPYQGTGSVCSTLQASTSYNAGAGWVNHRVYPNNLINQAAQSLYNNVYNQCKSKLLSSNWGTIGYYAAQYVCLENACVGAANQIVNAFVGTGTGVTTAAWKTKLANTSVTARSISPDCLGGWSNGKGVQGCFSTAGGSSPWGWDTTHPAQFNGPGSLYGCWD